MQILRIVFYLSAILPVITAAQGNAETSSAGERGDAAWAKVERLRPGQEIRVLGSGRQSWTGRLTEVSADALVLDIGASKRKLAQSEVSEVQVKSRAKSALIGLGVGAGLGVGVGFAAGNSLKSDEKGAAVGLGALLFAPAGAALGALAPTWKTVYRTMPPGSQPKNLSPPK